MERNNTCVKSPKERAKYGYFASSLSLIFNIILAISKIVVGSIFGLVSVVADGLNNLADGGNLAISLVGIKIANIPPDKKHPFGHARIEYIVGLVISIVILFIGFELFVTSIEQAVKPIESNYSMVVVGILIASIVIKLGLSIVNYKVSKKIDSLQIKATAQDSFNDSLITLGVLISVIVGMKTGVSIDAYVGIVVSLIIFFSGATLIKETISPLLGENADPEFLDKLILKVKTYDGVKGVHDVQAHNYGPNRYFVSLHVEVDSKVDVLVSHELIDKIESDLNSHDIHLLIHMDPIVVDDPVLDKYKLMEWNLVKEKINKKSSIHDFRMVDGKNRINLIFDVMIPFEDKRDDDEIKELIEKETKLIDTKLFTVVNIDRF